MTPANGSTEVWPGTHMLTGTAGKPINPDMVEPRRLEVPPAQVIVPKGAAIFRDLRMWHGGQPNYTAVPRHMMGIGCTLTSNLP